MNSVLAIGILMVAGLAAGRAASGLGVSSVVGYLLAGLLVGQVWPGWSMAVTGAGAAVVAEMGLAFIAFAVGGELEVDRLKSLPRGTVWIALAQAIGSVAMVTGATVLLGQPLGVGLVLGSLAAATAPSTTIMVVGRHKADGFLSRLLLSVVALNDAICIAFYSITVAVARALPDGVVAGSVAGVIGVSLWEILGSIVVGVVVGIALGYFVKYARGADELVVMVVGSILLASGAASAMHVSQLITCLVLGAAISNLVVGSRKLFASIDRFSPPVYTVLFCLAGAGFRFSAFLGAFWLFVAYVIARVVGKVAGAGVAAWLSGAPAATGIRLGISLLPQAGVAAALAVSAGVALPEHVSTFTAIIVPGVLLYEALGPRLMTKALMNAGEIGLVD